MIFGIKVILKKFTCFYCGNLLSIYILNVKEVKKKDNITIRMIRSFIWTCRV